MIGLFKESTAVIILVLAWVLTGMIGLFDYKERVKDFQEKINESKTSVFLYSLGMGPVFYYMLHFKTYEDIENEEELINNGK